jgi:2-polyprenyl-3-methyl-5-hydroxy-6-metoxy-1,4-benzoquinol methylase
MNRFAQRSTEVEIMDDLNCSGEVVHQTLRELEFINRTLGGNAVTVQGVRALLAKNDRKPLVIMDLGCGGGDMVALLKRRLNTPATYIGVDANPHIVAYAKEHNSAPDIRFEMMDIFAGAFQQQSCDVFIATLFFHHFTHEQLVTVFSQLKRQARMGIVINDLHRHPLAYYSIQWLTQLFSKSTMVKYDAPLSVLRGFKKRELQTILQQAGITRYTLRWRWAFRWQLIIPA